MCERATGIGLLIDEHQSHEAHQPSDEFLVHSMAFVLQVVGLLPHALERGVMKLLVYDQHQVEVHSGLALRRVIERRSRDRQRRHCAPTDSLGCVRSIMPRLTCRSRA